MTTSEHPEKLVDEVEREVNEYDQAQAEWDAKYGGTAAKPAPTPEELDAVLGLRWAGDVAAEVDAAPPRRWLFRRVWPSDAYGVVGAKHKAGKSWLMVEAAVAAASGAPWLGAFEVDTTGPVLLFAGEGGAAKLTRRGRAVAACRGHRWDDLPILVAERVPHLADPVQLLALRQAVQQYRPVLVLIDPLYLAVGAQGDGRNLFAMGGLLEGAQHAVQEIGAALIVSHHNNRDTSKEGSDKLSGAGPAEWGRVLVAMSVTYRHEDEATGRTDVRFNLDVDGDEVAGGRHSFRRVIDAADQDDLASPMRYDLSVTVGVEADVDGPLRGYSPAERRVLAAVQASEGWVEVLEIGDVLAEDGKGSPLKKRTIQDALKQLTADGLVRARPTEAGGRGAWRRLEKVVTDAS